MKKIALLISGLLILISIPISIFVVNQQTELRKKAAPATTLSLNPRTITKEVGETFTLEVVIDTAENQVLAAEVHLTFDATKLEAETITNGPLFPNIYSSGVVDRGTASITVGAASASQPVRGRGTAATVRFKTLQASETPVQIQFGSDSFVGSLGEGTQNVLIGRNPASVTIGSGGGGGTTPTPTPTTASSSTNPTPTPTRQTSSLTPTPTTNASLAGANTPTPTPTIRPGTGGGTTTPTPTPTTTSSSSGTTSISSPSRDAQVTDTTPLFRGTAPAGATVTITVYSAPQTGIVTADSTGSWSFTPQTALAAGPHTITVTATHPTTGQSTTASSSFVVTTGAGGGSDSVPVTGTTETTLVIMTVGALLILLGAALPALSR